MLRDFVIALSLSNLCFIRAWGRLPIGARSYFSDYPNPAVGALVDMVLLSLLFFAVISVARRYNNQRLLNVARLLFLLILIVPLNGLRLRYPQLILNTTYLPFGPVTLLAILLLTLVPALYALKRYYRLLVHGATLVVLMLSPFLCFSVYSAIGSIIESQRSERALATEKPAEISSAVMRPRSPRVVWIIFDELDERLAFVARPATINLPELDRMRGEALFATHAYSPARRTEISLPALLTGHLIASVQPTGPSELFLKMADGPRPLPWSQQPNVFSEARKDGFRTGLAGWYHPYCRVIGRDITSCADLRKELNDKKTLLQNMSDELLDLLTSVPLAYRFLTQQQEFKGHAAVYSFVLEDAKRLLREKDLSLVFLHFPVPHPPGIFDRAKGQFALDGKPSYLDNLALVDRTLGELRRTMEHDGTWDTATVIVSSDHWWRTDGWSHNPLWKSEEAAAAAPRPDHRVPFLVKLARQKESLAYDPEFNTVVTHDLVLALLRGELARAQDLVGWLDRHRSFGESPYSF